MNDYIKAWQCIGCGRIDGPQNCVGICQDRRVEFVYALEHEQVMARLDLALRRASTLEAVVRRLACTTPRQGGWERTYRALQGQALAALDAVRIDRTGQRDSRLAG